MSGNVRGVSLRQEPVPTKPMHLTMRRANMGPREASMAAITPVAAGRGTLRFPLDRPLPIALVTALVKQRAIERRGTPKKSR